MLAIHKLRDLKEKIISNKKRSELNKLQSIKNRFLSNGGHQDYGLLCSFGGASSSLLTHIAETLTPVHYNPVCYCSHYQSIMDWKLRHLSRPLDSSSLPLFSAQFQADLARSKVDAARVKKAVFVYSDPSLSTSSLYRRKLAKDHYFNVNQVAAPRPMPSSLEDFVKRKEDYFGLEDQLDAWLAGSPQYEILMVRYEALQDHTKGLADYLEVSDDLVKKQYPRKERKTIKTASYQGLKQEVYASLHDKLDRLDDIFTIKKTDYA